LEGNGNFHVIVGMFYMPQICDMGMTAFLPLRRKARMKEGAAGEIGKIIQNVKIVSVYLSS
jgi:hypothetical protein